MKRWVCALLVTCFLSGCACVQSDFARVETGMHHKQVLDLMGRPTDRSMQAWHWQFGESCDAWVFFDDSGRRVTGKYWQDEKTLRLDEIRPLLD